MDLTQKQWEVVEPLFPEGERRKTGPKGGRPWAELRDVLNGVLWVLRTGAPWADMPKRYPSSSTCHRRFQGWVKAEILPRVLAALYEDLRERGGVDNIEAFIDGTYVPAKKGDPALVVVARARPRRSWRSQTAMVFHSLLLLQMERDTTVCSLAELSTLLSWRSYLRS